jgi:hypothetical protein
VILLISSEGLAAYLAMEAHGSFLGHGLGRWGWRAEVFLCTVHIWCETCLASGSFTTNPCDWLLTTLWPPCQRK